MFRTAAPCALGFKNKKGTNDDGCTVMEYVQPIVESILQEPLPLCLICSSFRTAMSAHQHRADALLILLCTKLASATTVASCKFLLCVVDQITGSSGVLTSQFSQNLMPSKPCSRQRAPASSAISSSSVATPTLHPNLSAVS
jgi:hypothetical protein